ncbi:MAG: DUF1684 domain-containing protein [Acidobacteriota bacterium]|nr:DUF1684 domain-containing protein [Acidobacteriota bacterium]
MLGSTAGRRHTTGSRVGRLCAVGMLAVVSGCAPDAPRPMPPRLPPPATAEAGAGGTPTNPLDDPRAPVEVVERAVQAQRQIKDQAFKVGKDSPLPANRRAAFQGLNYFPFDARYRFVVKLEPCPKADVIETATTRADDARRYRCAGVFRFTVDGVACSLLALTPDIGVPDAATDLFIPFRDATSGRETYAAGRYLQLKRRGADAEYVLDFNQAFNPYCAYGGEYSCPLPPPENHLPVAIRAGEKSPS